MTREEAIKILEEEAEFLYGGDEPYNKIAFDMAIDALSAEAVQGEWHKTENEEMEITGYYCSVCDMPTDEPTHFCGNCGARMKGGDSE